MHPTKIINETESVSPRTAGLGILVALYPPFPAHGFRRSAFRVGYPLVAPNGARSIESRASHPDLRSISIEELSFTTVRSRLISVLLRLAQSGKKTREGIEIQLPPSNQELASEIGTVRELVSRNLSRLQTEGLIRLDAKTVVIPDVQRLKAELEAPTI